MKDEIQISDLVDCLMPTSRGDVYTSGIVIDIMDMDDGWPMYEVHTVEHGPGWFSGLELTVIATESKSR